MLTKATPPPLQSFRLSDFDGRPVPSREWLWDQIVPAGTLTLLSGERGIGKTHLLLQLAMAVATGSTFFGRKTQRGPVVLITAEDPKDEIYRRVSAISGACGIGLGTLGDIHIVPLIENDSSLLAERSGAGSIKWLPLEGQINDLIATIRPVLIVFDPASELFGGDENNRAEVASFAGRLRRLAFRSGAAVVLSIHPSVAGLGEDSGRSGSVAWANSARSRLFLKTSKDNDGLELHVTKSNFGQRGKLFDLRFENGAIEPVNEKAPEVVADERARIDELVLQAFGRARTRGLDLTHTSSRASASVVLAKDPALAGTHWRVVFEAIDRLLGSDVLELRGVGPPSGRKMCLFLSTAGLGKPPEPS